MAQRYHATYEYPRVLPFQPSSGENAHKVFIFGMLRKGLGGQVVPDSFGAKWLSEAVYLQGHSTMTILPEGAGLLPDKSSKVEIKGDLYLVSKDCLFALDRLANVLVYQRRAKIRVYRTDDGTETRAWCHFVRYPEKITSRPVLSGDYKAVATRDVIAYNSRAARCKSGELSWTRFNDSTRVSGYVATECAGATCIQPTEPSRMARDSTVDARTAYSMRDLKEGETRTIKTKDGDTVTYSRVGGLLTVKEWIGARAAPVIRGPGAPAAPAEDSPTFDVWADRKAAMGAEVDEGWGDSDEAKEARETKRAEDNKAAMGNRIVNCVFCEEEIYHMPGTGWVTWESGSPSCMESMSDKHKPEPISN